MLAAKEKVEKHEREQSKKLVNTLKLEIKNLDDHLHEQEILTGLVKIVHQAKIKSRIAGKSKKLKPTKSKRTTEKKEIEKTNKTSRAFYKISTDYGRDNNTYRSANTYELHYGSETQRTFTTFAKQESYDTETHHKTHQENETEKGVLTAMDAQSKIQKIIYSKLLGSLGDISVEDREMFAHWRKFNKTLRRMYEGGFYDSSVTKTV